MKWTVLWLAALLAGMSSPAAEPRLKGIPFWVEKLEVVWNAPTNHLPPTLWVYKVLPTEFSPTVLSNLMAVGAFTKADKRKVPSHYPIQESSLIHYSSRDETRVMDIVPAFGWVNYFDNKAVAARREEVAGVPTPEAAASLAETYLLKLGVDRSQLAVQPGSSDLKRQFSARTQAKLGDSVKVTNIVGVRFFRQLDGVEIAGGWGSGGLWMQFANHRRIAKLDLSWRNLKRDKLLAVATAQQLVERVKSGEAMLTSQLEVSLNSIKTLTVNKVTLFFWGDCGDTQQDYLYPFATLEVSAKVGAETVSFQLDCPILRQD